MRLLEYIGIVSINSSGIKSSKSKIGIRYAVNLGCLFALDSAPIANNSLTLSITTKITNIQIDRMIEFGENHPEFQSLFEQIKVFIEPDNKDNLLKQMSRPIENLDLSDFLINKLKEKDINTVSDILNSTEEELQKIKYIGIHRSRKVYNTAYNTVLEYLSG